MGTSKKSAESKTSDTVAATSEDGVAVATDDKLMDNAVGAESGAAVDVKEGIAANATPGATEATGATPPPAIKKTLGTKEVIPFAWKVIGRSGEMILTLFKSVERADADAHHARLTKDGAYKDLEVVALNHKIVQPKSVKEHFVATAFRDKSEVGSGGASGKKAGGKGKGGSKAKAAARKETRITSKKSSKKTSTASASKKAVKKTVKKVAKKVVKKTAKKPESAAKRKTTVKKTATKKTAKKKTAAKSTAKKKTAKKKTAKKKK